MVDEDLLTNFWYLLISMAASLWGFQTLLSYNPSSPFLLPWLLPGASAEAQVLQSLMRGSCVQLCSRNQPSCSLLALPHLPSCHGFQPSGLPAIATAWALFSYSL